jgi:gliding motility-associated-like protein
MDSVTHNTPLSITKPFASFGVASGKEKTCNNDTLVFSNFSTGNNLSYQWNFGDSTASTNITPKKYYTANGLYNVQLVVKDINGCTDTALKNNFIDVKEVKADLTASSTYGTCIPFYVKFADISLNETSRLWSYGDGNFSANANTNHPFVKSDTFTVLLTAYRGPTGTRCVDTATINIVVNAPTATLSYSPLEGCAPLVVQFNVTSKSNLTYRWDFGNGETSAPTTRPDTSHVYAYPNNFTPIVIIEDTAGCIIPILGTASVKVYGSTVNFKADTTLVCSRGIVKFTNLSVTNGQVANYLWNFGDGKTSAFKDPTHEYDSSGVYDVTLIINTAYGCKDTLVKRQYITVAKKPSISIDAVSEYCGPSTATFKGILLDSDGSPLTWKWNFGNGNSSDLQNPPAQQYTNTATYLVTLIGKSPSGCTDTANTNINIHPIPTVFAGNDTVICLNTTAQLFATGADTFSWQPTSSLSCTNCNNPVANPTDNITYTVTGKTVFGCTDTDEISIEVKKPFTLTGLQSIDSICLGKSIRLNVSGAEIYSWSPIDGLNNASGAIVVASPTTNTIYKVVGTDSKNCFFDSAFIDLKVNPNPTVNAGADMILHLGNSIQLSIQNSPDVNKWLWTPATGLSCSTCPAPIATPETNTAYIITVSNSSKCTASDEVFIKVVCDNSNLFLPTAFTPNGDGLNDVFYPMGVGLFKIQSLRIFNRYGQVVFEKSNFNANDRSAGWDGSYKGKTSDPAAYIYTLEVICKNNEVLTINGKILLIQ